ncbi:uncharacterized protein BJ171DRAFT_224774 [Polychytrium aggregatum]|uniref:uncharacterized protein n=1 Tax=Polychytrium aggregatum TaxID=110093 RepID=UPI0022FDDB0A|nr:uncharacterized protein BJ171DRAFT_224774 [Polychytrium aggregatum]KAI9197271.1 hypothetical protein BJ171DRAFT_224774 [Polychytrium aggregatum]
MKSRLHTGLWRYSGARLYSRASRQSAPLAIQERWTRHLNQAPPAVVAQLASLIEQQAPTTQPPRPPTAHTGRSHLEPPRAVSLTSLFASSSATGASDSTTQLLFSLKNIDASFTRSLARLFPSDQERAMIMELYHALLMQGAAFDPQSLLDLCAFALPSGLSIDRHQLVRSWRSFSSLESPEELYWMLELMNQHPTLRHLAETHPVFLLQKCRLFLRAGNAVAAHAVISPLVDYPDDGLSAQTFKSILLGFWKLRRHDLVDDLFERALRQQQMPGLVDQGLCEKYVTKSLAISRLDEALRRVAIIHSHDATLSSRFCQELWTRVIAAGDLAGVQRLLDSGIHRSSPVSSTIRDAIAARFHQDPGFDSVQEKLALIQSAQVEPVLSLTQAAPLLSSPTGPVASMQQRIPSIQLYIDALESGNHAAALEILLKRLASGQRLSAKDNYFILLDRGDGPSFFDSIVQAGQIQSILPQMVAGQSFPSPRSRTAFQFSVNAHVSKHNGSREIVQGLLSLPHFVPSSATKIQLIRHHLLFGECDRAESIFASLKGDAGVPWPVIYIMMVAYYAKSGNLERVDQLVELIKRNDSGASRDQLLRAYTSALRAYVEHGNPASALSFFDRHWKPTNGPKLPVDAAVCKALAIAHSKAGNKKLALEWLDRLAKALKSEHSHSSFRVDGYGEVISAVLHMGDFKTARSLLDRMVMRFSRLVQLTDANSPIRKEQKSLMEKAYKTMVYSYAEEGRLSSMMLAINDMRRLDIPVDGQVVASRLRCLVRIHDLPAAQRIFAEAMSHDSNTRETYGPDMIVLLMKGYAETRNIAGMVQCTQSIGALDIPLTPRVHWVYLTSLFDSRDPRLVSLAAEWIRAHNLTSRVDQPEIGATLISFYGQRGEMDRAKTTFDAFYAAQKKLAKVRSTYEARLELYTALICAHGNNGDTATMQALFREMVRQEGLRPNDVMFLSIMKTYSHTQNHSPAEISMWIQQYQELGIPVTDLHWAGLLDAQQRSGNWSDALETWEDKLRPDHTRSSTALSFACAAVLDGCGFHSDMASLRRIWTQIVSGRLGSIELNTFHSYVEALGRMGHHDEAISALFQIESLTGTVPNHKTLRTILGPLSEPRRSECQSRTLAQWPHLDQNRKAGSRPSR